MSINKQYDDFLESSGKRYLSLSKVATDLQLDIEALPFSLRVVLENVVRNNPDKKTGEVFRNWQRDKTSEAEIFYQPVRVLMQDFTGVPAVVDLATMRDVIAEHGGDPQRITPLSPVDLVIDHSVSVDHYGSSEAFARNMQLEFIRNRERYQLLKWAQASFNNFRVVPPGTGICHQVNLEYLAQVVWQDGNYLYPDTLVGTDSHTTMINALGILGWGVGGIEAEAAMLRQPISMLLPEVCGVRLTGRLSEGVTATDLVLRVVETLRAKGVVGKFVEYFGDGVTNLQVAERATIANMAPEYGATCGFFPVDQQTIAYLRLTGHNDQHLAMIEDYCRQQQLWGEGHDQSSIYSDLVDIDLASVVPAIAGPKRPQDLIPLPKVKTTFTDQLSKVFKVANDGKTTSSKLSHGSVVICAITSCTNTSNPSVMITAGLVARKALAKGLRTQQWVKTSLAPGSQVVSEYLKDSRLQDDLDQLGFHNVGYGCTTCIGNSGELADEIKAKIAEDNLVVCSVLSGNRNFEGRINQDVKANFLASPPLVVAYALVGRIDIDLVNEPLGNDRQGNPVYLRDIWPDDHEIQQIISSVVKQELFTKRYQDVFRGSADWRNISLTDSPRYQWQEDSTYIRQPTFFHGLTTMVSEPQDIKGAKVLVHLGDSVTTDHISPAGAIKVDSPAGRYLQEHGIAGKDFNSYGARRGNHEVMMRGTFANIRIKNLMLTDIEGGFTRHAPSGDQLSIYQAAERYRQSGTPLVVVAGQNYGSGSSRDWAAKGPALLGVKVVVCASIERIHRSNLIGMGILPLEDRNQQLANLSFNGDETFDFLNMATIEAGGTIPCQITFADNRVQQLELVCRIDTPNELAYYRHGGILAYVLRNFLAN